MHPHSQRRVRIPFLVQVRAVSPRILFDIVNEHQAIGQLIHFTPSDKQSPPTVHSYGIFLQTLVSFVDHCLAMLIIRHIVKPRKLFHLYVLPLSQSVANIANLHDFIDLVPFHIARQVDDGDGLVLGVKPDQHALPLVL